MNIYLTTFETIKVPTKLFQNVSLYLIILLYISGCALYKNPASTDKIAEEGLPENFLIPEDWAMDSLKTDNVVHNWYREFGEPDLNNFVVQALDTNNPGIVLRLARIQERIAGMQLARSGRQVFMNYGASYNGLTTFDGDFTSLGSFALPISWEADLWGRIKAGMLAANEAMVSEVHQYGYTRQTITANVARLYFQIGTIQKSLEIALEFREINQRLIEVQETREKVGIIDSKDVHLAKANVASIESIIAFYQNLLQIATRDLEVIMGDYPANTLQFEWEPEELETIVAVNNPFSLVSRRPDLLSLEAQVREAFYLTEQAELAKYPSLVLNANPSLVTSGGLALGLGASLFGPIVNGRAIRSRIEQANAFQRQLVAVYGSAILDAFKDVESSLHSEQLIQQKLDFGQEVAEESRLAYEVAVEQYRVGKIDLFNTLLLQGDYLIADLNVIQTFQELYLQRIQLYLSLGGNITQP